MIVLLGVLVAAAIIAAIVFGVFYFSERLDRKRLEVDAKFWKDGYYDKCKEVKEAQESFNRIDAERAHWKLWCKSNEEKLAAAERELDDLAVATVDYLADLGKVHIEPSKPARKINGRDRAVCGGHAIGDYTGGLDI